jgi:hypothetical protein
MDYIYNGPESASDRRYSFHWDILRQALERTRPTHGPYNLSPAVFMSEQRQQLELRKDSGKITVMILGTTEELERALTPIRIPVDKGLSGFFVCLIHSDQQTALAQVRTLKELRKFKVGLANDWLDAEVYKANGFQVIPGNNYDGLFHMTRHKRFDIFPRSVVEVLPEWESRRTSIPELAIENALLIHYHWPMYFWFSKTKSGEQLAKRAQIGLEKMLEDGSYDRLFQVHFRDAIERLNLKNRTLIELENPLLPKATPLSDQRLWFRR